MPFTYIDTFDEVFNDIYSWYIDVNGNRLNYDLEYDDLVNVGIEYNTGRKEWFLIGMRHRLNGPAVIYDNGNIEYRQYNQRHRENGPAVERSNGNVEYWFCDVLYTLNDYLKLLKLDSLS